MPRRGNVAKRDVLPDPMYNSKLVTRLINNVMYDGKKGVAQKIVYGAFEIVNEKTGKDALEAVYQGRPNPVDLGFVYYPSVNEFRGRKTLQIVAEHYCRIKG